MLRAVLTGVSTLVVAIVPCGALAACPSTPSTGTTVVPNVVRQPLNTALATLLAHHLRVSIPHIIPFEQAMAEQGRGRLANYDVIAQSPRAGAKVGDGRTIVLGLSDPNTMTKQPVGMGSIVVPTDHPGFVRVPDLIGKRYHAAMAAGVAFTTGVWVRVGRTRALTAAASTCGLDGLVVGTQTPAPGTRVPWQGVAAGSVTPALATVTIGLVSKA
jgi:beta-lactam-binding protein with PASTA domain